MNEKLIRLTERVWYYPYEEERDRPNLGYIRGDTYSIAVDAGHSKAHTEAFYRAIEAEELPLPAVTLLTHWHWDHTLGLHAIHGWSMAGDRTVRYLTALKDMIESEGAESLFRLDEKIRREYADGAPVTVTLPDRTLLRDMRFDAGGCEVKAFAAVSPHTDDAILVSVPGEGVLFTGDAECGVFPTWEKDPKLSRQLAGVIKQSGASICVGGHWEPRTAEEALADLL